MRRSLFRLYEQGQPVPADDPDGLAHSCSTFAARPPELARDSNLAQRAARRGDRAVGSDQCFRACADSQPLGEADPEEDLPYLDERGGSHEREPPRRRNNEERQEDRADEQQGLRGGFRYRSAPAPSGEGEESDDDGHGGHSQGPPGARDVVVPDDGSVDREAKSVGHGCPLFG
jgi:hypothetical protein